MHREQTYGHLTLAVGTGGGGPITITGIKVVGDKPQLSFTTPKPSSTHVVEQTSNLAPAQWTSVANVTFVSGAGGSIVATFPKPSNAATFYRVRL